MISMWLTVTDSFPLVSTGNTMDLPMMGNLTEVSHQSISSDGTFRRRGRRELCHVCEISAGQQAWGAWAIRSSGADRWAD